MITCAVVPACYVQSSTPPSQSIAQPDPGQPVVADPHPTPPPPQAQSPVIVANPPRPTPPPETDPTPPQTLPTANPPPPPPPEDRTWIVDKTNGTCEARTITHCPPRAMCNPPRPQTYACVEGIAYPAKVTEHEGSCIAERMDPCPRNAKCKAPQKVPCPQ